MSKYILLFAIIVASQFSIISAYSSEVKLELPSIISDNMVLQSSNTSRERTVNVWGWAEAGQQVVIKASWGAEAKAIADKSGNWLANLKAPQASDKTYTLSFSTKNEEKTVKNVLVGEVWLCSGQSNMNFSVYSVENSKEERAKAKYPLIRMFLLRQKIKGPAPQNKCAGEWVVCSPKTVHKFSGVGYFFGRELFSRLEIPVGLIKSTWSGTRIEAWFSLETAKQFKTVMQLKEIDDKKAAKTTPEECETKIAEIRKNVKQINAEFPSKYKAWKEGGKQGPMPRAAWSLIRSATHPHYTENYVANLYNNMIYPIRYYSIKGVIWYQGESNTGNAKFYDKLLEAMINNWRNSFDSNIVPFYCVQLPNYREPWKKLIQDDYWTVLREAYVIVSKNLPNVYYTINIDIGEAKDLHPKNKQDVGKRLGLSALKNTYGEVGFAWDGPKMQSVTIDGNKAVVKYHTGGAPLMQVDEIKGFGVADKTGTVYAPEAKIIGNDTVELSAPELKEIAIVAYAWADNPVGSNLRNTAGLPAAPFKYQCNLKSTTE